MDGMTGQPLELPAHQARTQVALPPEGVPVYCAKGDACQHALWTTVPQVLKGQLPGRGFLLTDADYKPLEPRQAVLAIQFLALVNIPTSSNYRNNIKLGRAVGDAGIGTPVSEFLRKLDYEPRLINTGLMRELTRDMVESHLAEFPPDCLPVYCARNDARQHALWTTLDRVRDRKPPGDGFLLTDADYRPLEPLTCVPAARLLSMGGCVPGRWQTQVRLGKGGDAEDYAVVTFLFVLRGGLGPKPAKAQGPNQSNSTQLPGSAPPGPAQATGPKPTLASQKRGPPRDVAHPDKRPKTQGAKSINLAELSKAGARAEAIINRVFNIKPPGTACEASAAGDLDQSCALPPLIADYQGTGQAVLKNEAEVIAALMGLMRALGQSNARVQLLQLFKTRYANVCVGYQALSLHVTSLRSAMQSGSSRAVLDVFRNEFGLDV